MTPAELLEELRRECPNARWFLSGPGSQQQTAMEELATLINRHRAEAYDRGYEAATTDAHWESLGPL